MEGNSTELEKKFCLQIKKVQQLKTLFFKSPLLKSATVMAVRFYYNYKLTRKRIITLDPRYSKNQNVTMYQSNTLLG